MEPKPNAEQLLRDGLKSIGDAANLLHNLQFVFNFYMDSEKEAKCRNAVIALTAWGAKVHKLLNEKDEENENE